MYGLYINGELKNLSDDLKTIKSIGFVLAVRGYKVAYKRMD